MTKPKTFSPLDFENAYAHLRSNRKLTEACWLACLQLVRFDPRIGELWLTKFSADWKTILPVELQAQNMKLSSPAVLGVLLDQYEAFFCPLPEIQTFKNWKHLVMSGVRQAHHETFFIALHTFAGYELKLDVERSLKFYSKWGFFGRAIFVNKADSGRIPTEKTRVSKARRLVVLKEFIQAKSRFTARDYKQSLGGSVSSRVAQNDINTFVNLGRINCLGETKNKTYRGA